MLSLPRWFLALIALPLAMAGPLAPAAKADESVQRAEQASITSAADRALALYRKGDLAGARLAYGEACAGQSVGACDVLGMMALKGQGGAADPALAIQAFQQSCGNGSEAGCVLLSGLFVDGEGTPAAAKDARATLTNACGDGVVSACTQLGIFMGGGIGGPTNRYSGRSLLEKSCTRGDALACDIVAEGRGDD